eukprot:TRINITY_DN5311_c0_g1_i1.p1 TRINITY_DN5311_c0_g1~~TRINITY_DN5311_c0_g1_i1.p1  ORF type:complete len:519 (+),score=266.95 TRINITY_DN5311_c0_g1_i1:55-1557(+)
MSLLHSLPIGVLTDSYKATHFLQYPESKRMVAYGEFRGPFRKNKEDNRMIFFGIRYIVENYLNKKWTVEDVERLDAFYQTHGAGGKPLAFPRDLFLKFVNENDGYFPLKLEALPEGTCANVRVPVYQITTVEPYSRLVTFFETILTQVWYPSTVATLSRFAKDSIRAAFATSVDDDSQFLLNSRLHDFGFRGCTCVEQSIIGGCAHLLNFTGSDTMSACFYAQFNLNNGKPVGESVPASEHSVMTSWATEREAILNMIDHFGTGLFSVVMDSYDYRRAVQDILPTVVEQKLAKGGFMVLRPDSGDPVDAVLMGLEAADKAFGSTVNSKGYKVVNNAAVLQGDGINSDTIKDILAKVLEKGFSAQSVVFGMGGGLLQKVNRDDMNFATKLSFIQYADGTEHNVMKYPKTDVLKISLPGIMKVVRVDGIPTVFPADDPIEGENLLKVVYDGRPVANAFPETFDELRARVESEWNALPAVHDPISASLRTRIQQWIEENKEKF